MMLSMKNMPPAPFSIHHNKLARLARSFLKRLEGNLRQFTIKVDGKIIETDVETYSNVNGQGSLLAG